MKRFPRHLPGLICSLALIVTTGAQANPTVNSADPASPLGALEQLFSRLQAANFSGIPDSEQLKLLAPLLEADLVAMLERARQVEQACARSTPEGDKPHMIEGDLFSGSQESYTEVAYGQLTAQGRNRKLALSFIYTDTRFPPAHHFRNVVWPGVALLRPDKAGSAWLLHDLKFAQGRGLRRDLLEFMAAAKRFCQESGTAKK